VVWLTDSCDITVVVRPVAWYRFAMPTIESHPMLFLTVWSAMVAGGTVLPVATAASRGEREKVTPQQSPYPFEPGWEG